MFGVQIPVVFIVANRRLPFDVQPHVLMAVVHEPANLWSPHIVVRVGVHGDGVGIARRHGEVIEILAKPHVPHAEQEHYRRVPFRQAQFLFQIDLPALQLRDEADLDQAVVVDAGVHGGAEVRERRGRLPVGSVAWAEVFSGFSQKYETSTW